MDSSMDLSETENICQCQDDLYYLIDSEESPDEINHYTDQIKDFSEFKYILPKQYEQNFNKHRDPFSHACLRCAFCIAIAEKINETFQKAYKYVDTYQSVYDKLPEKLRYTCNCGFQNYGMYDVAGYQVFIEPSPYATYIRTEYDGKWKTKLSEHCHLYLAQFGIQLLLQYWLGLHTFPEKAMIDILCRNSGLFNECNNIEDRVIQLHVRKEVPNIHCLSIFQTVDVRVTCPSETYT